MAELEKILLSWEEFGRLSEELVKIIIENHYDKIDTVIGIAKGGLAPSVYIANRLKADWDSIRIGSYVADNVRGDIHLDYDLHTDIHNKTVLLVDDIIDEGKTMQFALKHLYEKRPKAIITSTLVLKPNSSFKPDHYAQERKGWLVFPWEAK